MSVKPVHPLSAENNSIKQNQQEMINDDDVVTRMFSEKIQLNIVHQHLYFLVTASAFSAMNGSYLESMNPSMAKLKIDCDPACRSSEALGK